MYFSEGTVVGAGAAFVFLLYVIQVGWTLFAALLALVIDPEAKLGAAIDAEMAG